MNAQGPEPFRIGSVTVDIANERLTGASGQAITLRRQSFAVLRRLAATPDQLVTKSALMDEVWPGLAVTDDSLVQCIHEIRRALGPEGEQALRTVPRRGYMLHMPPAEAPEPAPARGPRWRFRWAGLLALALLVVVAGLLVGARRASQAPSRVPVVAVMPFADESGAYLGAGVAETIITMLGWVPEVGVIAQRSSFALHGSGQDVRAIGETLGADYVLEGSLRREGERLRVTAQLDEARAGRQVWADQFDEVGDDPVALADAVAGRIIFALAGQRGELRRAEYARAWGKDEARLGEYDYAMRAQDRMFADSTARGNAAADAARHSGRRQERHRHAGDDAGEHEGGRHDLGARLRGRPLGCRRPVRWGGRNRQRGGRGMADHRRTSPVRRTAEEPADPGPHQAAQFQPVTHPPGEASNQLAVLFGERWNRQPTGSRN